MKAWKKLALAALSLALLAGCKAKTYTVEAVVVYIDTYDGTVIQMEDGSHRHITAIFEGVDVGDVMWITAAEAGGPGWEDDEIQEIIVQHDSPAA